jgi:hypothetical protein
MCNSTDYVNESESSSAKLPAVMALGYVSAFSETMAKAVIDAKGILPLIEALKQGNEDHVRVQTVLCFQLMHSSMLALGL